MAREKKEIAPRLVRLPTVRCTKAELAEIQQRATSAGMTQSAYLRQIAVSGRVIVKQAKADFALVNQLMRIGVNLNQMTKATHTGEMPSELPVTLARLNALLDELIQE